MAGVGHEVDVLEPREPPGLDAEGPEPLGQRRAALLAQPVLGHRRLAARRRSGPWAPLRARRGSNAKRREHPGEQGGLEAVEEAEGQHLGDEHVGLVVDAAQDPGPRSVSDQPSSVAELLEDPERRASASASGRRVGPRRRSASNWA